MTQDLILSVRGLQIRFGLRGRTLHAIREIDLDLYRGEVLALVGESGSGKSVLTKSFMGLLDANGSITGGSIDYYPTPGCAPLHLAALKTEKEWLAVRGREIAMVMQDPMTSLNPLKTIGEQITEAVTLHQGLKGAAARERRWNTCGTWASRTPRCGISSTRTSFPAACGSGWSLPLRWRAIRKYCSAMSPPPRWT